MNTLRFREKKTKNPFKKIYSSPLPNITEQSDVPEEEEIYMYNSLKVPKLIAQPRQLEINSARGSNCYCCYITS